MSCEEVREQLPDYVLGTLSETEAVVIRRHLRGCGSCRAEAARLDDGVVTFGNVVHTAEPPEELRHRVMSALEDEWRDDPSPAAPRRSLSARWLAMAAAVLLAIAAFGWAGWSQVQASRVRADAARYHQFLDALGGREVRVALLDPKSRLDIEGTAILYDSDVGRSWILVVVRAPGYSGPIAVTLSDGGGRSIALRTMEVDQDGDASTWLVTSADISKFSTVELRGSATELLASGVAT